MTENYLTGIYINAILLKWNKSLNLNSNLRNTQRMNVHFDWFLNECGPLFTERRAVWSQNFESLMHFL